MSENSTALARAEECLTALLDATRVCVKADRIEKQVPTDERASNGQPKSKRVPTGDYALTLFEGGSITCATKEEADAMAAALTKAMQDVLEPLQKKLIVDVRKAIAGRATLPDDKKAVTAVQAARRLSNFVYTSAEKTAGYVAIPGPGAIATIPGDDQSMAQIQRSLDAAIKKVTSPICERLRSDCDQALAEALES